MARSRPIPLALGERSFSVPHRYLDDSPSGTPSDVYTVTVTVTDDDTGEGASATTITVNNVAPVITAISSSGAGVGDAAEGEMVTIQGAFTDVGALDTHTAVVDWDDGTTGEVEIVQGSGGGSFAASHAYSAGASTPSPSRSPTMTPAARRPPPRPSSRASASRTACCTSSAMMRTTWCTSTPFAAAGSSGSRHRS